MNRSTIIEKLSDLRYQGAKDEYIRQCEDIGMQSVSFDERLFSLLDAQALFLANKRIAMNRKLSKIKNKSACITKDQLPSRKRTGQIRHTFPCNA